MDDLEERIRQRAYQLWQEEGCPEGQDEAHWERARAAVERESQSKPDPQPPVQ
jgi:hypothetical protein